MNDIAAIELERSRENLIAVLNHALASPGKLTQEKILDASRIGISRTEFNKLLRQTTDREFNAEQVKALWDYAHANLMPSVKWAELQPKAPPQNNQLAKEVQRCAELHKAATNYYKTHSEQMALFKKLKIEGYYDTYKYSYRWHKSIVHGVGTILQATVAKHQATIFVERQVNSQRTQEEDTVAAVYSKTNTIWIEGQETAFEQPRKFALPLRTIEHSRPGGEFISSLCGFVVETYAKWPNHYASLHGGFTSPFALQRIPQDRLAALGLRELVTLDRLDATLRILTEGAGRLSRTDFERTRSISPIVKNHMKYYDWSDSNRQRET